MDTKIAGGVLLIVGTAIGGGMLALPIVSAGSGFWATALMLIFCWLIMTFSAFLLLEVNLWLPPRNNIISMAKATLGKPGIIIAGLSYILLLYSLLSAYIAGGSSLFHLMLTELGLTTLPEWFNSVFFVCVFGLIVFRGIQPIDYVNRALMLTKFGSLFILLCFAMPHVTTLNLLNGTPSKVLGTITVIITSFGFSNIIPSLRSYFQEDVKKLRLAILIGSLIPLICYLLWDFVVLGSIPSHGEHGLLKVMQAGGSVSALTELLSFYLNNTSIMGITHLFTSICVLTSFLCVSLALTDFLADGLQLEKKGKGNWIINGLTFLPPLFIVIFFPNIFVAALKYAGVFCIILLMLLPAGMVWSGRYYKMLSRGHYTVMGGKLGLVTVIVVGLLVIGLGLI